MEEYRRAVEPGAAARAGESAPRVTSKRIEGGSAAKAAEERARNTEQDPPYRGSVGVTLRVSSGAKFQFPDHPSGPGEAVPVSGAPEVPTPSVTTPQVSQPEKVSDASPQSSGGFATGIFRRLFRR